MIISKIYGGLGNQLFQYALGRYLALKNNTELKLDISLLENKQENVTYRKFELKNLNIEAKIASEEEINKIKRENLKGLSKSVYWRLQYRKPYHKQNIIKEKNFTFDNNILDCKNNVFLDGYWQSHYYFDNIRAVLLDELTPKHPLDDIEKKYLDKISNSNSVSVHIRRGDYLTNSKNKEIYLNINLDYFKSAINFIESQSENVSFYIFSDDMEWAKNNIKQKNINFVDVDKPVISLYLMRKCQHHIIANSTFGWWGAWLNEKKNKIVISPKEWFASDSVLKTTDLIPEKWIKF